MKSQEKNFFLDFSLSIKYCIYYVRLEIRARKHRKSKTGSKE